MGGMKWEEFGAGPSGPQPAVGSVTTQSKKGSTTQPEILKEETVAEVLVQGRPAVVGFGAGLTLNLGDFESARVDVRIDYPCPATPQGVAAAYEWAKAWVTERLQAEVKAVRARTGSV